MRSGGKNWDQRASWLHTEVYSSSGKGILAQEKQFHICTHTPSNSLATRNVCVFALQFVRGNLVCKRSPLDGMWRAVTASILSSSWCCYVREGSCELGLCYIASLCKRRKLRAGTRLCNRRKRCSYQGSSSPTVTPRLRFNSPEYAQPFLI